MTQTHPKPLHFLRRPDEGHAHVVLGMRHEYKARPSEGAPTLTFITDVPPGCGAPSHAHERDGEAFYVLEGELTFTAPEGSVTAGPGSYFYAGPGHVHAFVNLSGSHARALVVQTPGIEAEQFFEAIAAAAEQPGFDVMQEIGPIADLYGVAIQPPMVAEAA